MLCRNDSVMWNIPHIQSEYEEYSTFTVGLAEYSSHSDRIWEYSPEYYQSDITLLWL